MSNGKIACLALYGILVALALLQAGSTVGSVALWVLVALAVIHVIEMMIFLSLARRAPGSTAGHLLNVFLFGVFHQKEMKAAVGDN